MMVVDSSAIVAILEQETNTEAFWKCVILAEKAVISAASVIELSHVMVRRKGEAGLVMIDRLLHELKVDILPVSIAQIKYARQAMVRFGKGFHPASLNFGDCFAYALAKEQNCPLLYKGNDFSKTDIVSAI